MKRIITPLRYLVFLAIGAGLLWLTFRHQSFGDVVGKIRKADPYWIAFSILLSIFALISRALRWVQLIEPLGFKPRLSSTFKAILFGYLANMAVPRLGEISRCGALGKSDVIPVDKLIGTVIVERICDVLMLLVTMITVAVLEFDRLGGFLQHQFIGPAINKISQSRILIGIILIIAAFATYGIFRLFKMKNPPKAIQKTQLLLKGIGEGLRSVMQVKNKGVFLFHSVFIWVMYWLMTYVCFFALPVTSGLSLFASLFLMLLGSIGMTAPVQGGIGTYHLLVSQGLLLYGLTETDGIVFATMVHTTQTLLMIIGGGLSMLVLFFFTKQKPSAITSETVAASR